MPLKGLIIDNGIGSGRGYPDREEIQFDRAVTGPDFQPDLSDYDVLIVPNGTDHVAMYGLRDQVRAMLDAGKAVFCFCGWFTDWLPGYRWVHDNSHPTREMRHFPGSDPHSFIEGFDLGSLDYNPHGISGWWACGYIESQLSETVLIKDTWDRAVVIADDVSTPGFLFLTASGPVGDYPAETSWGTLGTLYRNVLNYVVKKQKTGAKQPQLVQGEQA